MSTLLTVRDLSKTYGRTSAFSRSGGVRAVDRVSFDLAKGEILGLVGESGSGKTTLGRCVLRLIEPDKGLITFDGVDVMSLRSREMRRMRRRMQIVFQDASAALNPKMTVRALVGEPLQIHEKTRGSALTDQVAELLNEVGLDPHSMKRYPREFSGGQRQRIGIARALALRPDFVVCDEPVTALDVSVQAQILNLLARLQAERGLSYLFISHDLRVVGHLCDRVMVMNRGQIVEDAPADQLFDQPAHAYTRSLIDAML